MRPVRTYRLLRHITVAARERTRQLGRAPADPELRARRGMVLGLPGRGDVRARARPDPARAPSGRPARAGPGWAGPVGLADAPALDQGKHFTDPGSTKQALPGATATRIGEKPGAPAWRPGAAACPRRG